MALKITDPIIGIVSVTKEMHDVSRINSIKKIYPEERQESKAPTFALTR